MPLHVGPFESDDLAALIAKLNKPPAKAAKGKKAKLTAMVITPAKLKRPKKTTKPQVIFYSYWGWSGISFWG